MKTILVTGASGYIGSITVTELALRGYKVIAADRNITLDDAFDPYPVVARKNIVPYILDYSDSVSVQQCLLQEDVDAVVHIGATSLVGPSVTNPALYYENNVEGTKALLDACRIQSVNKIVFASSAATYGEATGECVEDSGETPCNPYGWSKRMTEIMLQDYHTAYGIDSISFRYFNVAGSAHGLGQQKQATHLIARIMESKEFTIFGTDYDTPDGTAIRDYVHVSDIANAHVAALQYLENNSVCTRINLGSGVGNSVKQIISAVNTQTDLNIKATHAERRAGDPARLVANIDRAKQLLNWEPQKGLDKIVYSAYNWYYKQEA